MSEEKYGVKETKEVMSGANELSLFLVNRLKDGYQFNDVQALVTKLLMDQEFKNVIEKAVKDANQVPAEMKDLSWSEASELAKLQMDYIPKFIEAAKKVA